MSRETIFSGEFGWDMVTRQELVRGKERKAGEETYLIGSPTFERLSYWAKVVPMIEAHFAARQRAESDKKRRFFRANKNDVYLIALLDVPLFSEDVRLSGYPETVKKVGQLNNLVHQAYAENNGLICRQRDFPTYSSATIEMRWVAQQFEPTLGHLATGVVSIDSVLAMIDIALQQASEGSLK